MLYYIRVEHKEFNAYTFVDVEDTGQGRSAAEKEAKKIAAERIGGKEKDYKIGYVWHPKPSSFK